MSASPLPSPGPTRGRKCYVTPAFPVVHTQGDKFRRGCLTPAVSGGQKWTEVLRNPCVLRGPQTGGQNHKWVPHPCLLGGPKEGKSAMQPLHSWGYLNKGTKSEVAASPLPSCRPTRGRKCYLTLAFSGVPNEGDKIRSGCLTPVFSRVHKWAEVLRNPYLVRGPQEVRHLTLPQHLGEFKGTKSEVVASPLHIRKPTSGRAEVVRNSCVPGSSQTRQQKNQKWLPHPYLL